MLFTVWYLMHFLFDFRYTRMSYTFLSITFYSALIYILYDFFFFVHFNSKTQKQDLIYIYGMYIMCDIKQLAICVIQISEWCLWCMRIQSKNLRRNFTCEASHRSSCFWLCLSQKYVALGQFFLSLSGLVTLRRRT